VDGEEVCVEILFRVPTIVVLSIIVSRGYEGKCDDGEVLNGKEDQ